MRHLADASLSCISYYFKSFLRHDEKRAATENKFAAAVRFGEPQTDAKIFGMQHVKFRHDEIYLDCTIQTLMVCTNQLR